MTDTNTTTAAAASPRPWRVNGHSIEANDPEGLWLQNEKTGWGVVANLPSCPKSRMSKKNRSTWDAIVEANAALIVAAVNAFPMTADQKQIEEECDRKVAAAMALLEDDSKSERDRLREELDSAKAKAKSEKCWADHYFDVAQNAEAERDRLRDIVRRMLPLAEVAEKYADADAETIKGICARKGVDSSVVDAIREKNANLLREARAAIGEGKP